MRPEGGRALSPSQAEAFNQAAQGAIAGKPAPQAGGQDGPEGLEHGAMQGFLQDVFWGAGERRKPGERARGCNSL